MDDKIKIVKFEPQYTTQVQDLIHRVLTMVGVGVGDTGPSRDGDLAKIDTIYFGRGRFWVALKDDQVVGTVAIREIDKNKAKLNRMFVNFDYHGSGLGQNLFNTALEFAKQQGYKMIVLNTDKTMTRAHRFYEKNGFQKIGQTDDSYQYELSL